MGEPAVPPYDAKAGKSFVRAVAGRLQKAGPFPPPDSILKKVACAIARVAVRRLVPLVALVDSDAWPEAAMVARSLVELDITASYMLTADEKEAEKRAQRFLKFEVVQRQNAIDRVIGQKPDLAKGTETESDYLKEQHSLAVSEFSDLAKSASRGWSGIGIAGMAAKIESEVSRRFFDLVHRHAYPLYCDYAHPSPVGIRHAWTGDVQPWPESLTWSVPLFSGQCAVRLHNFASVVMGVQQTPSIADLEEPFGSG